MANTGSAPHFIVTLESNLTGEDPPLEYHPYIRSFGSAPNVQPFAVDASGGPSDGDVYVADNGARVVRKYDPSGNLITTWADNGVLDGSAVIGEPFGKITGLAVRPNGGLYVGTYLR